jgi:hypothetical protein
MNAVTTSSRWLRLDTLQHEGANFIEVSPKMYQQTYQGTQHIRQSQVGRLLAQVVCFLRRTNASNERQLSEHSGNDTETWGHAPFSGSSGRLAHCFALSPGGTAPFTPASRSQRMYLQPLLYTPL